MADAGVFFSEVAVDAQTASAATGVLPSVILAQWADETGYGTSSAFLSGNNYAGVSPGGSVGSYPSKRDGLSAYISALNQHYYDPVRLAKGSNAQAIALGQSPWAGSHYDYADYSAGLPLRPGVDLVTIIQTNNLTTYDTGSSAGGGPGVASLVGPLGFIAAPAPGMGSSVDKGTFILNGSTLDADVSSALADCGIELTINGASTLTLILHDPDRVLLNSPVLQAQAVLNVDDALWQLVAVDKTASLLKVVFEPWVVVALRSATGAFTVAPGIMTRTQFAEMLVAQVQGATFAAPTDAQLLNLIDPGNANNQRLNGSSQPTQEQLSRGTINLPLEDSWTCLQRIATEIQWRCFEVNGTVYFGPDSWLTLQPAAITASEFVAGVSTIDGQWDIGQPLGNATVECVAGAWTPSPGQVATLSTVGVLSGNWLVASMSRRSVFLPDITVMLQVPQPSLPEPAKGGAQTAVGAGFAQPGNQQTTGGVAAAAVALNYALAQVGTPYRYGGDNPATGFDCSGLMLAAYASAGINIPRTSEAQFAAGPKVPDGVVNLRPGDLVFFGSRTDAGHVGMVVSVDLGKRLVTMVDAPHTGAFVRQETFTPTPGASWGTDIYLGATRPAQ